MRVLLVDDDTDLLDVTAYALRREGFTVLLGQTGEQALQCWETEQPSVVVLDVGLPDVSGYQVCSTIRKEGTTPVILLTAHNQEDDIVQGFRAGADDYVTKPFSHRQLALRIRAVARRGGQNNQLQPAGELTVGELTLDVEAHQVRRGEGTVQLTPIEFRLLYMLACNAGRVVSSERLVDYVWGPTEGDKSLLKTHICHIRSKLKLPSSGPGSINSIPRVGYRLTLAP
jgi:DNA-binding response OmpR family regulator